MQLATTKTTGAAASIPTIVRALCVNRNNQFLAQVSSRVAIGCLTILVPEAPVPAGTSESEALARVLQQEVGLTVNPTVACKFLSSRVYEFTGRKKLRLHYYQVTIDAGVPYNMDPERILSLSWMTLAEVQRYLELDDANWKIQFGTLDVLEMAVNPNKPLPTAGVVSTQAATGLQDRAKILPYG